MATVKAENVTPTRATSLLQVYEAWEWVTGQWLHEVQQLLLFIVEGGLPVWRVPPNRFWRPFDSTDLARLLARTFAGLDARFEVQNADHEIYVWDFNFADRITERASDTAFGQSKKRAGGTWITNQRNQANKMRIRIPHK